MTRSLPSLLVMATAFAAAACSDPGGDRANDSTDALTEPAGASHGVLPGEFEPVDTLVVSWSDAVDADWQRFTTDIIHAAAPHARVLVLVGRDIDDAADPATTAIEDARATMTKAGVDLSRVTFQPEALNSAWVRDYGPELLRGTNGKTFTVADMDCCGDLDQPQDEEVPIALAKDLHVPVVHVPLSMQGGNLQSDGQGRCITTQEVIDGNGDEATVRQAFADGFGCTKLVILPSLEREVTGHVDMLATITGPAKVLVGQTRPNEDAANAAILDEAAKRLTTAGFSVMRIPMPRHGTEDSPRLGGLVMPSYTNAVAVNDVVLVPVYTQDRTYESQALAIFKKAYPGRTIVPIEAGALIEWGGAVHCTTMTFASAR